MAGASITTNLGETEERGFNGASFSYRPWGAWRSRALLLWRYQTVYRAARCSRFSPHKTRFFFWELDKLKEEKKRRARGCGIEEK